MDQVLLHQTFTKLIFKRLWSKILEFKFLPGISFRLFSATSLDHVLLHQDGHIHETTYLQEPDSVFSHDRIPIVSENKVRFCKQCSPYPKMNSEFHFMNFNESISNQKRVFCVYLMLFFALFKKYHENP